MAVLATIADVAVTPARTKAGARTRIAVMRVASQVGLFTVWMGMAGLLAWIGSLVVGPTAVLLALAAVILSGPIAAWASDALQRGWFARRFGLESLGDEDLSDLSLMSTELRRVVLDTRMARSVVDDDESDQRQVLETLFGWIHSVEAGSAGLREALAELGLSTDPVRELLFSDVQKGQDAERLSGKAQSRIVALLERFENAIVETPTRLYR